ncbi:MAG TPA: phosphate ABC transporter permease subunit PstC [Rhodothermales bacterium]|nr:phosphate ABC transporter permease subunit PstC [Rhodothermales bacterium]HRR07203.1 phosphate ABC transporter permease subunit PstC [Rhodothermales bacterium]
MLNNASHSSPATTNQRRHLQDRAFKLLVKAAALLSVLVLAGIFFLLIWNGFYMFKEVSIWEFFFSSEWNPGALKNPQYGIGGMVVGTMLVTIAAMVLAFPLGIALAAYLSEVASPLMRGFVRPLIELLAGIPSVVVGFIGIVVVGPFLAQTFNLPNGFTALNGAILLAIMALPSIVTVAEDAIRAVPRSYREASYALGSNKWTTLIRVTLPAAGSGIIAAGVLGVGRAVGETMTVLMATGNALEVPDSLFDSVRTMTATMAIEMGEVPFGTTHYYSLFAIGATLFIMSLLFNLTAEYLAAKFRRLS